MRLQNAYYIKCEEVIKDENGEIVRMPRVMSPAIDAGDPASSYSLEPSPNGRCANLGFYCNKPYASRSESSGFILFVR